MNKNNYEQLGGGGLWAPTTGSFAKGSIAGVLSSSFTVTHSCGYIPSRITITTGSSASGSQDYDTPICIGDTYINPTNGAVVARITNGFYRQNSGGGASSNQFTIYSNTYSARYLYDDNASNNVDIVLTVSNVTTTTFDVTVASGGRFTTNGTILATFNWVASS